MIRLSFFFFLFLTSLVPAQDEWRSFTSKAGSALEAKVISIDGDSVTLVRKDNGKKMTVKITLLSPEDGEFLKAYQKQDDLGLKGETSIAGIDAVPGKGSGRIKTADGKWSYFVYLPKDFHTGRQWPVCFVMSSGGAGDAGQLNRYIPGAELVGCILILSSESKNDFTDSSIATLATAKDVFDRFPVADGLAISSGMSGGSREAYFLAERENRIGGILACGSGYGVYLADGSFRHANLPRSTNVYSLIGTNDFNRPGASEFHAQASENFRLRFFPGNHDWAPSEYIIPGLAKLYGQVLLQKKDAAFDAHRRLYTAAMAGYMDSLIDKEPWEAASWATFLSGFSGYPNIMQHIEKTAAELNDNPQVQLAQQAEKDMRKFREKYLIGITHADRAQPDAQREAEANKLAAKYASLPHGDLFTRLGQPCP